VQYRGIVLLRPKSDESKKSLVLLYLFTLCLLFSKIPPRLYVVFLFPNQINFQRTVLTADRIFGRITQTKLSRGLFSLDKSDSKLQHKFSSKAYYSRTKFQFFYFYYYLRSLMICMICIAFFFFTGHIE
jgi:hypothetical protein